MRIGLLSDVHGNLPALEAVLEACSIRCDALWCLGDTVGYGASPNECVDARPRPLRAGAGRQPRPGRDRSRRLRDLLQRRRPRDPLDARGAVRRRRDVAGQPRADGAARADRPLPRARRAIPCGSTSPTPPPRSTRCRGRRTSWCWCGHTHVPLAARLVGRRPDRRPGRRRRRRTTSAAAATRCSTPARSASRATATPAPRGCCCTWTTTAGPERAIFQRVRYDIVAAAAGDRGRRPAAAPRRPPLVRHVGGQNPPTECAYLSRVGTCAGTDRATPTNSLPDAADSRFGWHGTRFSAGGAADQLRRCAAVSACSAACRPRRRTIVSRARNTRRRTSS